MPSGSEFDVALVDRSTSEDNAAENGDVGSDNIGGDNGLDIKTFQEFHKQFAEVQQARIRKDEEARARDRRAPDRVAWRRRHRHLHLVGVGVPLQGRYSWRGGCVSQSSEDRGLSRVAHPCTDTLRRGAEDNEHFEIRAAGNVETHAVFG